MEHLAAAEDKRKLNLVPFFDKLACVLDLYLNIVGICLGPQPDFLE